MMSDAANELREEDLGVPTPDGEAGHPEFLVALSPTGGGGGSLDVRGIVGERLSLEAFAQLSGNLAGFPFVKVVVDRPNSLAHFINHGRYQFHAHYIAENLLGRTREEVECRLDEFNRSVYLDPDRRFYLGIISLHSPAAEGEGAVQGDQRFFSLETVEIDNMSSEMLRYFYGFVKDHLDPALPLLFKPANHLQETIVSAIPPGELPRVFSHQIFSSARYIALNAGRAKGRLRVFRSEAEYRAAFHTLEWYDIIVMDRVPDDIPRLSGIVNAKHTTPLSHTNVLASGWRIPNAIQLGIFDRIEREGLELQWVEYAVDPLFLQVKLTKLERPLELSQRPAWSIQRIKLEEPETMNTPIVELDRLRMSDRYRYGTKAANLGELRHVLDRGSERLVGFYKVKRPPRPHLLPYLARLLGVPENQSASELSRVASEYLRAHVKIPRGIAIPFSVQQEFLESSPRVQQGIGKLKMALELDAREVDPLCLSLQNLIRGMRVPARIRDYIDERIAESLSGVSSFVVRSSSNAEDLEGFSAAGIYESINHVTTAEKILASIKEVWASLVSPRSVRLRHEVGIALDDCYMGVIVQEEVPAELGGVLVTANPLNREGDFRNVYLNVSDKSVISVVQGAELPFQYLYNTVEGGGRTLSLGSASVDLDPERKKRLQIVANAGRLLQSHYSPDYTFATPVDIEWVANSEGIFIVQLRPYKK